MLQRRNRVAPAKLPYESCEDPPSAELHGLLNRDVAPDGLRGSKLAASSIPDDTDASLILATCLDALDELSKCLDRSDPEVEAKRERVGRLIALGKSLVAKRVNSLDLMERFQAILQPLNDQINQIATNLDGYKSPPERSPFNNTASSPKPLIDTSRSLISRDSSDETLSLDMPIGSNGANLDFLAKNGLQAKDSSVIRHAKLARQIIRQRQQRARFFEAGLFADPAWDMLLDLFASSHENTKVSVTSLCIASGIPSTTALRWIGQMAEVGLIQRHNDEFDKRRAFLSLTDKAMCSMTELFLRLESSTICLV